MSNIPSDYSDFQACMTIQPRRKRPHTSKKAKNLAEELLQLVNNNQAKAKAILRQLVLEIPNKSTDWYYEMAVYQVTKNKVYGSANSFSQRKSLVRNFNSKNKKG